MTTPTQEPADAKTTNEASFSDRLKKAFDFASDSSKQLITLATGIVTLTITFAKDIFTGAPTSLKYLLAAAWLLYLVSILGGLATLLALTGTLEPITEEEKKKEPSIRGTNVTSPSMLQLGAFFLGTLCIISFAIAASWASTSSTTAPAPLSSTPQAQYVVTAPALIAPAKSELRLIGDGRYLWTTGGRTTEGSFFYDAAKGTFRFSGTLARWGAARLAPDGSIIIQVGQSRAVLTRTRWMCPFWPICRIDRVDAALAA